MASNNPSNTTDTNQRLKSVVPNDYSHLGTPGTLNLPLNGEANRGRARRRVMARRGRAGRLPNWFKAMMAIGGAFFAFGVVALVIFLIAFPPFFRNLEPLDQQRIINHFPLATYFKEELPFEVLPTVSGGDSNAAQQLLLTQESAVSGGAAGDADADDPLAGSAADGAQDGADGSAADTTPEPTNMPIPTPTPQGEVGGIPVGVANTPEPTPLPTYAPPPTQQATPAPLPTLTPMVRPTEVPLPATVRLQNIKYELQGWNNCGPTTMTMALSYFGWTDDQTTAANWMKPDREDKNVSPWQMVRFVNDQTGYLKSLYRYGGTITTLKRLLAAGFPVVVEESIQPSGEGWMGHYVLMVGYDDTQQHFLTYDSYLGNNQGNGRPSPYSTFDEKWRHFNRVFMVVYRPDDEMKLRNALGDYVDPQYGYKQALDQARTEANRDQDDMWAWFNMGTAYVKLKEYDNAAIAYDYAFQLGLPFRMLWYQFGPYEAYYKVGRYNDVRAYANATKEITPYVEETYYWWGMADAAEGRHDTALNWFNRALQYNRNFFPALAAREALQTGTFEVAAIPG